MISLSEVNSLKTFTEIQTHVAKNRPLYIISEGNTITWKCASDTFDVEKLSVGSVIKSDGVIQKAMTGKKAVTERIPKSVYGIRLLANAIPIVDSMGEIAGAFTVFYRLLHPVAAAFHQFAPILADMFPEGVILYMTDLQRVMDKQASKVFDLPIFRVGDELKENDIALKAIKTRRSCMQLVEDKFDMPVLFVNNPLIEEGGDQEVVATFGIVIPKKTASRLRTISEDLDNSLTGISSAIQQLAASASQIYENEKTLNTDIQDIIGLSDGINNISAFIKEIADQTNMLGLNAAIEAARAGDAGRGFGVVAEEIRKLSEQSKSTVPQIKSFTENIKHSVEKAIAKSNISLDSSQEQAAATEEITASIEEITAMSEELNKVAQEL
jgi:uncharacterized protein YoxC